MVDATLDVSATVTQVKASPNTPTDTKDGKRNNFRRGNDASIVEKDLHNFSGKTPEMEVVLTLLTENVQKGVPFEKFQEKLRIYALKNFKHAKDVIPLIVDIKDLKESFEVYNMPADLEEEEKQSLMKFKLWEMRLKKFLDREEKLSKNIIKIYGIVLGQCMPSL